MSSIMLSEAQKLAKGLRELVEMYETYPGMPVPDWPMLFVYSASPAAMVQIAKALGAQKTEKDYSGDTFTLTKIFSGNVRIQFSISREQVCTKVVVETEVIPEHVVPEQVIPAKLVPERVVERVEWRCHPLLAPSEPGQLTVGADIEEKVEAVEAVEVVPPNVFEDDIPF